MRKLLDYGLPSVALALLVVGGYWGLFIAPTEREMGEVYRVIYVHVPAAWTALIAFTVTLIASVTYLMNGKWGADTLAEASAEVRPAVTARIEQVCFSAIFFLSCRRCGRCSPPCFRKKVEPVQFCSQYQF